MRWFSEIRERARLSGESFIPRKREMIGLARFILIDVRVLFIVVSVYITVATAISTAANNEAADDASANRTFNLTTRPEHINLRISGGVSNAILWNCRENSVTHNYYRTLYGLLFTAFALILLVFIITRLSIIFGWMDRQNKELDRILWQIQLVRYLRKQISSNESSGVKAAKWCSDNWDWMKSDMKFELPRLHWSTSIVPYFEAAFLVLALPFMLTTYDIQPIGCLTGPDENAIGHNSVTNRVQLNYPDKVLAYQKAALVLSVIMMIPIVFFACLLLYNYFMTTNAMMKKIYENQSAES